MFSIEIAFADGVSQPETILVRRPQALIGSSDYAHVVIDDLKELNYQIRLIRELGRRFRTKPVSTTSEPQQLPPGIEGMYEGSVSLNLGKVRLLITALDVDLQLRDNEPPDRAGVRTLRQTCTSGSPYFPAVVVRGAFPMVISFSPEQPVYIGRLNKCAVRLDSADISSRHARMGYENRQFWIEDLGSTNGTFVHEQQISGRVNVQATTPIVVGREVTILGVTSEEELINATRGTAEPKKQAAPERRYPILISVSELVRPARVVMAPGMSITVGRDPSSDIWVGAPHVSRKHCTITMDGSGNLNVTDSSTNGTVYAGGVLRGGQSLDVNRQPKVLDFSGGVTVGICFNEADEQLFTTAVGAVGAFAKPDSGLTVAGGMNEARKPFGVIEESDEPSKVSIKSVQRLPVRILNEVMSMYSQASKVLRAFMIASVCLFVLVAAVILNLLLPVWFR